MKFKKIILILIVILLCSGCKKEEDVIINEYDTDMVCTYDYLDEYDDEEITSTSNIYVSLDNDLVNKAIYQSIVDKTYDTNSYSLYDEIVFLYNTITGIEATTYETSDKLVLEISYDFTKIDLEEVHNKLGDLLDDTSILKKADTLPVSKEEFIKIELSDYDCKENKKN